MKLKSFDSKITLFGFYFGITRWVDAKVVIATQNINIGYVSSYIKASEISGALPGSFLKFGP